MTPSEVKIVEEELDQMTPLVLGFVPPSCRNNTPSNSGDDQNQEEDPDEESGVETVDEESDDDDTPRASKLPPRQESQPKSDTYHVVTAAMRKGQPVCDLEEVLKSGLDPRKMPMNPENTPPSPPQSRGDRSVLGEELERTQTPHDQSYSSTSLANAQRSLTVHSPK